MQAPRMADDHKAPQGTRAAEKENDVMAANRKPRYATLDDGADAVRRASRRRSTSPTEVRRRLESQRRKWDATMADQRAALRKGREETTSKFDEVTYRMDKRQAAYEKKKKQKEEERKARVGSLFLDFLLSFLSLSLSLSLYIYIYIYIYIPLSRFALYHPMLVCRAI